VKQKKKTEVESSDDGQEMQIIYTEKDWKNYVNAKLYNTAHLA
jgi:hypothetical protein